MSVAAGEHRARRRHDPGRGRRAVTRRWRMPGIAGARARARSTTQQPQLAWAERQPQHGEPERRQLRCGRRGAADAGVHHEVGVDPPGGGGERFADAAPASLGRHQRADRDLCRQGRRLEAGVRVHGAGHGFPAPGRFCPSIRTIHRSPLQVLHGGTITDRAGNAADRFLRGSASGAAFTADGTSTGSGDAGGPAAQEPGVHGHGAHRRDVHDGRCDRGDGDVLRGGDGGHDERHAVAEGEGGHGRTGTRSTPRARARRRSSSATRWWRRTATPTGCRCPRAASNSTAARSRTGRTTTRRWPTTPSPQMPTARWGTAPAGAEPRVRGVGAPPAGRTRRATASTWRRRSRRAVTVGTAGGTPSIALQVGSKTRRASYHAGSGSTVLTFRYSVVPADRDADGVSVAAGRIALNGGTLKDASDDDVGLGHAALAADANRKVGGPAGTLVDLVFRGLGAARHRPRRRGRHLPQGGRHRRAGAVRAAGGGGHGRRHAHAGAAGGLDHPRGGVPSRARAAGC